jgi:hypothetical protein
VNPDGGDVRVLVQYVSPETFRWVGTSQEWSSIGGAPGTRCGARSGDGRHYLYLDNTSGFLLQVAPVSGAAKSFLKVGSEPAIEARTSTGGLLLLNADQAALMSPGGDALQMGPTDVILMHRDGVANLSLRSGDLAALSGTTVQISGANIQLGGGVVAPTNPYILSMAFLTALNLVLAEVIAIGAGIPAGLPVPTPNTTLMQGNIATSLAAGAPYLSTRINGD